LFGIEPTGPHTGYGYIRKGAAVAGCPEAFRVAAFVEKPDLEKAKAYLAAGDHYWNSGIFVLHAATFVDELARFCPEVLEAARAALEGAKPDLEFVRLDSAAFNASPSISVDYAVMERTDKAVGFPLAVGWNDVGSWSSLWDLAPRQANGNFVRGDVMLEDSRDLYVDSQRSLVAAIGVKDLVIVDTADALLVADRNRSQDVSKIVARLKKASRIEADQLRRNYRPWGFFESLATGPGFQVKLLHVNVGGKLSLQRHRHRSEHWIVVRGAAKVTVDATEQTVRENQSVYISATQWHRLENPGDVPLEIIEVQIGGYLGEDDIERSDDIYGRSPDETR
jgi:mannose-1-phosphate guanylyltransferase/mannose-6-phosphate isomerase